MSKERKKLILALAVIRSAYAARALLHLPWESEFFKLLY